MIVHSQRVVCSHWFGSVKSLGTHTRASMDKQIHGPSYGPEKPLYNLSIALF